MKDILSRCFFYALYSGVMLMHAPWEKKNKKQKNKSFIWPKGYSLSVPLSLYFPFVPYFVLLVCVYMDGLCIINNRMERAKHLTCVTCKWKVYIDHICLPFGLVATSFMCIILLHAPYTHTYVHTYKYRTMFVIYSVKKGWQFSRDCNNKFVCVMQWNLSPCKSKGWC